MNAHRYFTGMIAVLLLGASTLSGQAKKPAAPAPAPKPAAAAKPAASSGEQ